MKLTDNQRLYDIATRHQVYIEGVKVQFAKEFKLVLSDLRKELYVLLGRIKYKTLDGLTKAELNNLVLSLRKSQSKIYSEYTTQIVKQLVEFIGVDLSLNRRAYVKASIEFKNRRQKAKNNVNVEIPSDEYSIEYLKEEAKELDLAPLFAFAAITGNNKRLWSIITSEPIPANGLYLLPFFKTFSVSAQASVENAIRKAWANGLTVDELLKELTSDSRKGSSSQLQRIEVQASAVIATALQHVSAIVSAGVMSLLFGKYQWHSIMDSRTSEICISRNGKIYTFGKGPRPPAHIRCRSHIAPLVTSGGAIAAESFYTWASRQPAKVQDEISRFNNKQPLPLEDLASKLDEITSR